MVRTELNICDAALMRAGIADQITPGVDGTIAASGDTTVEQRVSEFWYSKRRDALLTRAPWSFARKYIDLVLNDDGDGEEWENEWQNAYTYPADCLQLRRFVSDIGGLYAAQTSGQWFGVRWVWTRGYDQWRYVVRSHDTVKVILTDVATTDATMEYTFQQTDADEFTEPFASVLAWDICAEICIPLGRDEKYRQRALQMRESEFYMAAAQFLNEEHDPDLRDGEFVTVRSG